MYRFIKLIVIKMRNVRKKVFLHYSCNIGINSMFEGYNYIGKNSSFSGVMGKGTYVGDNSNISGKFGRYTCIAGEVKVINGFHPIHTYVSLHPSMYGEKNKTKLNYKISQKYNSFRYADESKNYSIVVGNDVWIGFGAKILAGINIGDGAVVAAGAIVTKDVKPYTIVAGIPAKEIGKRFENEIIYKLLKIKWWNKTDNWIQNNIENFIDVKKMLKKIGE